MSLSVPGSTGWPIGTRLKNIKRLTRLVVSLNIRQYPRMARFLGPVVGPERRCGDKTIMPTIRTEITDPLLRTLRPPAVGEDPIQVWDTVLRELSIRLLPSGKFGEWGGAGSPARRRAHPPEPRRAVAGDVDQAGTGQGPIRAG
jgi:hypothetical protein